MDNYRVVDIMGGLGNQMFIYAFSLALKNKKKDRIFMTFQVISMIISEVTSLICLI